jgi:hypothetical protein
MKMKDPLLKDIRRARARRSKELARDLDRALAESDARLFTWGHDVVDCSSGEPVLIFMALRNPAPKSSRD